MNMTGVEFLNQFVEGHPFFFLTLLLWSIVWKGLALWRAAELRHKYWFIIILIVNSIGILDIIYLYFVARKYKVLVEVVEKEG